MISADNLKTYQTNYNKKNKAISNVVANNPLTKLQVNREVCQQYQHYYNVKTKPHPKVTNQKSSGRCWMFAALNVIRREVIRKYKIEDFEFSQSYLFFWDKLERLNYAMESIINTKKQDLGSREVMHLLDDPTCDGGQWDMFCNLVRKYGLVPKTVYRETYHSSHSKELNAVLKRKFREYALKLRDNPKLKEGYLSEIYSILCQFLGEPPKTFTWHYGEKSIRGLTPESFRDYYVDFNVDDFVCLINDPRHDYNKLYGVKYLGNVKEGNPVRYLNLEILELKKLALKSLEQNQTVWFGCDVMQHFDREQCAMDLKLVDNASLLGIKYGMSKKQRLQTGESLMTHAMVFTGARTDSDGVSHWQVENSWSDTGPAKGFYNMSMEWFNEYVFEVVVKKSILTDEQRKFLDSKEITELPPWDPMGALAN